jgi:hypothetical protein
VLVLPQSSEEDTTSVSIIGWVVKRRIDCCIRIVGLSRILFWDWGDESQCAEFNKLSRHFVMS